MFADLSCPSLVHRHLIRSLGSRGTHASRIIFSPHQHSGMPATSVVCEDPLQWLEVGGFQQEKKPPNQKPTTTTTKTKLEWKSEKAINRWGDGNLCPEEADWSLSWTGEGVPVLHGVSGSNRPPCLRCPQRVVPSASRLVLSSADCEVHTPLSSPLVHTLSVWWIRLSLTDSFTFPGSSLPAF